MMDMFLMNELIDAIKARQQGRELARSVGFSNVDQTRIAFTISELAYQLLESTHRGHMVMKSIHRSWFESGVEVRLYDHSTDMSLINSNWLQHWVDDFEVHYHEARGTTIVFRKWLKSFKGLEKQAGPYVLAAGEE
ncbi:serine/threonine-protein kinase RsbT [Paenibacillus cellulosilyticus]|uniref:Serine/threonine-protein kinase RsbT n=1 Tax=Paenibacillus cellulosilyticus TaxID=375489 RepID=A0A2V2YZA4_9BACL|nr:hypothetical protein [Paenibacillus cellulosilyticus]PWW07459.1 serine/threonine-protein kinase RsbT [Paenibacillus cellulosilyticus]QKS44383.1 hypothetical protein HUB94_08120 [Paenibacillus cellulosilyticus]